jgi:VWFA-related protein
MRLLASLIVTSLMLVPGGGRDAQAVSAAWQGQPPPSSGQPTFRSATSLVEVDAIVHDKDGNFATSLTADDLELFEDGKPQKIQQFYLVTHDPGGTVSSEHASATDFRAKRIFVIVFDEAHLANDSLMRVKEGAMAFVRDRMGPNDVGGIFINGGMFKGRLTSDKTQLIAGVHEVRPAFENRQTLLMPFQQFPRIPGERDATRIAEGARELVDELGVKACREYRSECELNGGVNQVENLIQQKARLYVRQARILADRTAQNLQIVARGLSRLPGRKTIVFLSEGFYLEDSRSLIESIAARAARGGSTIYSIDGRGLIGAPSATTDARTQDRGRSTAFDTGDDGPNILTAGTGGFMVRNIDDMSRAFGMIVRDTSTYYVIGYQPTNATMDGKYRRIEVKSKVAGLSIRARKGYAAVALPPPESLLGGGGR